MKKYLSIILVIFTVGIDVSNTFGDEKRNERKLPYFLYGPTVGLNDKEKENAVKSVLDYRSNACIGFGMPKNGREIIKTLRQNGVLIFEDSHLNHVDKSSIAKIRNGEIPYCMKGGYQDAWLKGLPVYVKENDVDGYCTTIDEVYWNNLFFGYGLARKYCEDQPVYSHSKEFAAGFNTFCKDAEKKYHVKFSLPDTGRTRILKENTISSRKYILYRYKVFAEALKARADVIKKINPNAFDYIVFSAVAPLAMERYPSSIAWDIVGQITQPDFMVATTFQTFQDYRGKYTHLYLTEAACQLVAANRPRAAGVVMAVHDNCVPDSDRNTDWPVGASLYYEKVKIRPVDIIGQVLSYAAHGLRGILCYSPGPIDTARGKALLDSYKLLKKIEPLVEKSKVPSTVAFLHSRASEDFYSLYNNSKRHLNADDDGSEAMRRVRGWAQPSNRIAFDYNKDNRGSVGFRTQKNLLHFLINEAIPFEFFYLEQINYEELKDYKIIILPFPYSISKKNVSVLEKLVTEGKTLMVYNAYGQTDEEGNNIEGSTGKGGRLLKLIGLKIAPPGKTVRQNVTFVKNSPILNDKTILNLDLTSYFPETGFSKETEKITHGSCGGLGVLSRTLKKGKVFYLGGDFGLKANQDGYRDVNLALLHSVIGKEKSIEVIKNAHADIEVAVREISEDEKLVFVINWENRTEKIFLKLPLSTKKCSVEDLALEKSEKETIEAVNNKALLSYSLKSGETKVLHINAIHN